MPKPRRVLSCHDMAHASRTVDGKLAERSRPLRIGRFAARKYLRKLYRGINKSSNTDTHARRYGHDNDDDDNNRFTIGPSTST